MTWAERIKVNRKRVAQLTQQFHTCPECRWSASLRHCANRPLGNRRPRKPKTAPRLNIPFDWQFTNKIFKRQSLTRSHRGDSWRTCQWNQSETSTADPFDQIEADKSTQKVDSGYKGCQPDGHWSVVESGHLNNGGAVVPVSTARDNTDSWFISSQTRKWLKCQLQGNLHDGVDAGDLLEHLQKASEEKGSAYWRTLHDLNENIGCLSAIMTTLWMIQRGEKSINEDVTELEHASWFVIPWARVQLLRRMLWWPRFHHRRQTFLWSGAVHFWPRPFCRHRENDPGCRAME